MQAIQTKYHGPTNSNGSRYSARCDAGRVTIPMEYGMNSDKNHAAACEALLKKLGWVGEYVGATLPDQTWAWVRTDDSKVAV